MKTWVYKQSGKLNPATSKDKENFDKLPNGEPFMISYVRVRNPRHHRKYFAFIGKVYENLPECLEFVEHPNTKVMVKRWPTPNNFRKQMEMYAGYYDETITMKGEIRLEPKSIKYETLGEDEFSELHTDVKNVIGRIILPKMNVDVVEREVEPFYG